MIVPAGQSPDRGSGPGVVEVLTPAEEAAFWARMRRDYPLEFGGIDAAAVSLEPPGPDLLTVLLSAEVDDESLVDDDALVGACLQILAEPVPVGRGHRRLTTLRATGTEIAIRTGCSVRAGELLARDGRLFDGPLADTGAALCSGQIDPHKARLIADRLADVAAQTALAVQAAVLPDAGRRSPAQLDRDLTRALIEVEPDEADRRHDRARQARRVCHPRLLPDGMAGIWAVLPAEHAILIDTVLDAAARTARTAGDPRTIDQLRADALTDLVTGPSTTSMAVGTRTRRRATSPTPVHVDVLVPLSALLGVDDSPADLAGYGTITATQARALAAGGTWRRLVTDPLTGTILDVGRTRYRPPPALRDHVNARDRTCARPGCSVPAHRAELDHTIAYHGTREGPTADHNLTPLCATDHAAKTLGLLRLDQPRPGVLIWTTPTGQRIQVVPGRQGEITPLPHRRRHTRAARPPDPPF